MRALPRLALALTALVLLAGAPALAQLPGLPRTPGASQPAPRREAPTTPGDRARAAGPTVHLGALLPLTGAGAWFGKEMRQGLEMAITELNRAGRPGPEPEKERAEATPKDAAPGDGAPKEATPKEPAPKAAAKDAARPAEPPLLEGLPAPGVALALDAADVHPLDVKRATDEFARLAGLQVPVVFTASVGPTLAIRSLAAARDVLVIHQGVVGGRIPPSSRTLLHLRPPVGARVEALLAHAAAEKVRRLALVAAGDEFGKAVRAAVSARWREHGGSLVGEESLSLDAPDLRSRFRRLARLAPEAVVLGFEGSDAGDVAARLRSAGYAGPLYLLDDDPGVRLAGGPAVDGAVVVSDAFVPEPGSAAERFASAYKKRFGELPSAYAARAFDAVLMVAEGLRAAAAEGRPTPGGARLGAALLAVRSFPSIGGGRVVLQDDGTLARPLALFTVEDGKLAFVRHLPPAGQS
jgi:ABC-type branched-subunit amino acid transport system substrate-binding protein